MNRAVLAILLSLIFLLLPSPTYSSEEITLPITRDTYLKEKPVIAYPWYRGFLSLGFSTNIYTEGRTRIILFYDLNELSINSEEIETATLNLVQYRSEANSAPYFDVRINPYSLEWAVPYSKWPPLPEENQYTLSRIIQRHGGLHRIDITDLIKHQLNGEVVSEGLIINEIDESKVGVLYYSNECYLSTLYYYPQCDPSMVPSITIKLSESPPSPPQLTNPSILTFDPESIGLSWTGDQGAYYIVEISEDSGFEELLHQSPILSEFLYMYDFNRIGEFYWRVKSYKTPSSTRFSQSEVGVINIENLITVTPLEQFHEVVEPEEKKAAPTAKNDNPPKNSPPSVPKKTKTEPTKEVLSAEDKQSDTKNPIPDSTITCIRYLNLDYSIKSLTCPDITNLIKNADFTINNRFQLELRYIPKISLITYIEQCKFKIIQALLKSCKPSETSVNPHNIYQIKLNGDLLKSYSISSSTDQSKIIQTIVNSSINKIEVTGFIIHPEFPLTKIGSHTLNTNLKPAVGQNIDKKLFIFPFGKNIGVTQWHGVTEYSNPHTGIDFGSKSEEVRAVGDGTIEKVDYDNYNGPCLSGGHYITIRHNNGKYSVYMHLSEDSITIQPNQKVRKGDIIALSGNSGAFNCQPLGYHLHLETRESALQSTHTDPVKLIEHNWNLIPTLGYTQYPGRLTGNNPHPGK